MNEMTFLESYFIFICLFLKAILIIPLAINLILPIVGIIIGIIILSYYQNFLTYNIKVLFI